MNVWKSRLCCSCWHTPVVCMNPIFLGLTKHYCVSWCICFFFLSQTPMGNLFLFSIKRCPFCKVWPRQVCILIEFCWSTQRCLGTTLGKCYLSFVHTHYSSNHFWIIVFLACTLNSHLFYVVIVAVVKLYCETGMLYYIMQMFAAGSW